MHPGVRSGGVGGPRGGRVRGSGGNSHKPASPANRGEGGAKRRSGKFVEVHLASGMTIRRFDETTIIQNETHVKSLGQILTVRHDQEHGLVAVLRLKFQQ